MSCSACGHDSHEPNECQVLNLRTSIGLESDGSINEMEAPRCACAGPARISSFGGSDDAQTARTSREMQVSDENTAEEFRAAHAGHSVTEGFRYIGTTAVITQICWPCSQYTVAPVSSAGGGVLEGDEARRALDAFEKAHAGHRTEWTTPTAREAKWTEITCLDCAAGFRSYY